MARYCPRNGACVNAAKCAGTPHSGVPDPGPDAKTSQRDHWNNSDYKTSDKAKRFIDTITQPESYWWAGGE